MFYTIATKSKYSNKKLIKIMLDSDMELVGLDSPGEGKEILKQKGISWTENHLTVG